MYKDRVIVMAKITKDMLLGDVVKKHPEAVEVFFNSGMGCAMCHMASHETIGDGAKAHGVDVKKLVQDLNKAIKKKK
jgi:hybrid cluster-associated redox disulfide protein